MDILSKPTRNTTMRRRIGTWLFAASTLVVSSQALSAEPVDEIIAVVNDDIVLLSELNDAVTTIVTQFNNQGNPLPPLDVVREQVLERLIVMRLQLTRAETLGLKVTDTELNQAIQDIARRNDLSLTQFIDQLEGDGVNYPSFRDNVRDELTVVKLRQRDVDRKIGVSDREVENAMQTLSAQQEKNQSYKLRHILVAVPENSSDELIVEKNNKANSVVTALKRGANFPETAVAESDGPNALEGGSLGWRKANELPTLFLDALQGKAKDDIVGPIRSPNGFHVLFVEDKRSADAGVINETKTRHILIRTGSQQEVIPARNEARQIRQRIIAGERFADLAKSFSDDPGSGQAGGDLGWTAAGTFVGPFEDAMNELAINEISQPVQTQFGWHIIQVLERREKTATLDDRREEIRQAIAQRKLNEEVELWQRRLRDEAYVDVRI